MIREGGLTYDDYAALDDGNRYELVEGRLELMSPGPSVIHQLVSYELQRSIARTCEKDYVILYAPIDLILSDSEVRQPDILLVRRDRMHILSKRGVEGPPDLVVEILSPSTLKRDKIDKLKTYARFRIPEYWVLEPELGVLEQYVLQGERFEIVNIFHGDDLVTSPNMPCVSFTMKEIMDRIPKIN
ncbi:MAG: hypothetical protein BAA02_09185 [Paenibacillaceae bacterium ZCTH02-B3]|nr:MAG: hypothetical protein BAA02_09185 [Paenibacillaceae bacterium ZCTH02-B3]